MVSNSCEKFRFVGDRLGQTFFREEVVLLFFSQEQGTRGFPDSLTCAGRFACLLQGHPEHLLYVGRAQKKEEREAMFQKQLLDGSRLGLKPVSSSRGLQKFHPS